MTTDRLHPSQVEGLLSTWPEGVRPIAVAARDLVLELAPHLAERVAFGSLCYYKPGVPYGAIGGNVCLVSLRGGRILLGFLHGAFLPDPEGLLEGAAKAKRVTVLRSLDDLHRPAVADLVRAAVAYDPAAAESRDMPPRAS